MKSLPNLSEIDLASHQWNEHDLEKLFFHECFFLSMCYKLDFTNCLSSDRALEIVIEGIVKWKKPLKILILDRNQFSALTFPLFNEIIKSRLVDRLFAWSPKPYFNDDDTQFLAKLAVENGVFFSTIPPEERNFTSIFYPSNQVDSSLMSDES